MLHAIGIAGVNLLPSTIGRSRIAPRRPQTTKPLLQSGIDCELLLPTITPCRSGSQSGMDCELPTATIEIALLCTITDLVKALISVNTGVALPQPFDDCIACRCGLALLHLPASSAPPSSNQNSARATLPSINHIKATSQNQRATLPAAPITLTGVLN